MTDRNKKAIKVPSIIRTLLNPARGAFGQCTESTQNNFLSLSQVLAFTGVICGCILGCSISKFGFNNSPKSYLITLPIGIGFYWFVDKLIIMADANKNLDFIKRSRYFIAIVFGLLNSFLINAIWFSDDIRALREKEISSTQSALQKESSELRATYQNEKNELYKKIDGSSSQMKLRLDSLIVEYQGNSVSQLRGEGKDYRIKYAAFKNDSLEFERTNNLLMAEARKKDTLIESLNQQTLAQTSNVPKEISKGISHSMDLLEEAIWFSGNNMNRLMAILLFLGAMILELLPLMGKHYYDLDEYFNLVNDEKESSKVNSQLRKKNYISREAQRLNFQNQRMMSNEYSEHVLQGMKDDMTHNEAMIDATNEHLEFLEDKKMEMEKKHSQYSEEFVKPLFKKVHENFRRNNEKSFSKQKFEA